MRIRVGSPISSRHQKITAPPANKQHALPKSNRMNFYARLLCLERRKKDGAQGDPAALRDVL
jgi:hypothetical protein